MAFSFGFSDDVGSDDDMDVVPVSAAPTRSPAVSQVPVRGHKLDDLVDVISLSRAYQGEKSEEELLKWTDFFEATSSSHLRKVGFINTNGYQIATLPERLSYSTVRVESPLGRVVQLPRRELFDVRAQLLQEDSELSDQVAENLEKSDLRSGIYEGGFKTWECSIDLASLLLDRGPRKDIDELVKCDQIVELGAGSALPTLILFRHAFTNSLNGLTFTLADYNEEVLRLITLPNLILTWAANTEGSGLQPSDHTNGDLELTPELIARFKSDMQRTGLTLNFVSGPWSSELADMIPTSAPDMGLVILAAETIYSPESTEAFVDLLVILLKRVKMAKAMIAAKRMYFGVGGSVDGLKESCRDRGAVAYEVENHGVPGMDAGIGRALVEVQMY